jgi:hypothetical protein
MENKIPMPDTDNCTEKQWYKWYWSDFNEYCKQCQKKCKQSHVVKLSCPDYKKIEIVNQ